MSGSFVAGRDFGSSAHGKTMKAGTSSPVIQLATSRLRIRRNICQINLVCFLDTNEPHGWSRRGFGPPRRVTPVPKLESGACRRSVMVSGDERRPWLFETVALMDTAPHFASFDRAACHSDAVYQPVARVEDDGIILIEPLHHLGPFKIPLPQLEQHQFGPITTPDKAGPVVALTEECGDRDARSTPFLSSRTILAIAR